MDYNSIIRLGEEIRRIHSEHSELLTDLDTLVMSLDGQWTGKAQKEFAIAYDKLRPRLLTINKVLDQYAVEVTRAASCEAELESINKTLYDPITKQSF